MDLGRRLRVSQSYVILEDHKIPETLELETTDLAGRPNIYARIEVDSAGPRLAELRLLSEHMYSRRGIRQADLRNIQVSALVEDVVAAWTFPLERDSEGGERVNFPPAPGSRAYANAVHMIGRTQMGRSSRDITPQLLERVTEVYRANISGYPTKAVQHHFQVSQRMAAEYVSRARKRGLLPPTKKGKKQA